jgi:hypothetical protein
MDVNNNMCVGCGGCTPTLRGCAQSHPGGGIRPRLSNNWTRVGVEYGERAGRNQGQFRKHVLKIVLSRVKIALCD